MTVGELIEELKKYPADMKVLIYDSEFMGYGDINELKNVSVVLKPYDKFCAVGWMYPEKSDYEKKIAEGYNLKSVAEAGAIEVVGLE
jgi:hypothetical protein